MQYTPLKSAKVSCIALVVGEFSIFSGASGMCIVGSFGLEEEVEEVQVDAVKPDEKEEVDVMGMVGWAVFMLVSGVPRACRLTVGAGSVERAGFGTHGGELRDAQWKPGVRSAARGGVLVTRGGRIFLTPFFILRHRPSFESFFESCDSSPLLGALTPASISFSFSVFILRPNMFRRVFCPRMLAAASHFSCIWTSSYDMTVIFGCGWVI